MNPNSTPVSSPSNRRGVPVISSGPMSCPPEDEACGHDAGQHHGAEKDPPAERQLKASTEAMTRRSAVGEARTEADEDTSEQPQAPAPRPARSEPVRPRLRQRRREANLLARQAGCQPRTDRQADDEHELPVDDRLHHLVV